MASNLDRCNSRLWTLSHEFGIDWFGLGACVAIDYHEMDWCSTGMQIVLESIEIKLASIRHPSEMRLKGMWNRADKTAWTNHEST